MTCDGCVRSVTRAIQRVAPTAEISVDLAHGWVTVAGEAGEAEIMGAIETAGFIVEGSA